MQANWIGKSEGVNFGFPYTLDGERKVMRVFTTRADTIMGVTFCAVAAEHPLAAHAAKRDPRIAAFVAECKRGSVMEADLAMIDKKGMPTGLSVTHPLTGESIEVWVGNYVLMGYGEGAVMGVPGHDERDFAFAKQYGLPIKQVIDVDGKPFSADAWQQWYADYGRLCINSGKYDGLGYQRGDRCNRGGYRGEEARRQASAVAPARLGISRQRYWGTPVPIIHCPTCGDVPVPDKDLPVALPENLVPDGTGNPLAKTPAFLDCQVPAVRGSPRGARPTRWTRSWTRRGTSCASPARTQAQAMVDERVKYWLPVDQYIGGIEHAILHLLYARFWSKVMRDLGLVKFDEPFSNLLTQGMVLNHVFLRIDEKGKRTFFAPEELDIDHDEAGRVIGARAKSDGLPVDYAGISTMSKSSRNGVDPQELIEHYGADTARFFIIFTSPPEQTLEWSDAGVEGSHRFLRRVWISAHGTKRASLPALSWSTRKFADYGFRQPRRTGAARENEPRYPPHSEPSKLRRTGGCNSTPLRRPG